MPKPNDSPIRSRSAWSETDKRSDTGETDTGAVTIPNPLMADSPLYKPDKASMKEPSQPVETPIKPAVAKHRRRKLFKTTVVAEKLRARILRRARESNLRSSQPVVLGSNEIDSGSDSGLTGGSESEVFDDAEKQSLRKRKRRKEKMISADEEEEKDGTDEKGWFQKRWDRIKRGYQRLVRADMNPLFRGSIKRIECMYGSGYASFFIFLRYNLMLDISLCLWWLGLVVIPTAIRFDYGGITRSFKVQNLFDGKDYLSQTWVFYGNYPPDLEDYHMDFYYLLSIYVTHFGTMLVIMKRLVSSLSSTGGVGKTKGSYPFSSLVLSSWDFSVAEKEGVDPLQKALETTAREMIAEQEREKNQLKQTKSERYKLYLRRLLMWTLTVIVMCGAFAAVFFTVQFDTETKSSGDTNIWKTYGPALVLTVINAAVPTVLELFVAWSKYSTTELDINITIGKVYTLRIVNIAAFIFGLVSEVNRKDSGIECPGTYIGQAFYTLVLVDSVTAIITRVAADFAYFKIFKKRRELYVSNGVLVVIYRQALIWIGTMFVPILPVMGVLSLAGYFGAYYLITTKTSCPPTKRSSQNNRENRFFLKMMFMTIVLIALACSALTTTSFVNINTSTVPVSSNGTSNASTNSNLTSTDANLTVPAYNGTNASTCGPFTLLPATRAYQEATQSWPTGLTKVLDMIESAVVLVPLVIVMLIYIYYKRSQLSYEQQRHEDLCLQLQQEQLFSRQVLKSTTSSSGHSLGSASSPSTHGVVIVNPIAQSR